jgi:DamX protein
MCNSFDHLGKKMAATEFNNRLDYLTSYSSQLVFVCSDKIQHQSQVVDSFLAHQDEQADIALLTANELTPLVSYREKLYRQLVSPDQAADFNRPLNQLLASLNEQSGSILISIFHAEKLPNQLIKELWDLVLQSRFASNKQHLNVLLMGLSDWADAAKNSLGSRSKEQPIILSSQINLIATNNHDFSDLDSLIQSKRSAFALRVKGRRNTSYSSDPVYKKWWMSAILGLVFLSSFIGLLGWQYPNKVAGLFTYFDSQVPAIEQTNIILDSTDLVMPTVAELMPAEQMPTLERNTTRDKYETQNLLVTDWQTASAKLVQSINDKSTGASTLDTDEFTPLHQPQELVIAERIDINLEQNRAVSDYQIPDEVPAQPLLTQQTRMDFIDPNPNKLLELPQDTFVIQIAAMANMSILQKYVQDEELDGQLWLYKTQRYGADWYVLIKNQAFPSIQNARLAITGLSEPLLRSSPFVKKISQIKQEIALSAS